MNELAKAIIPVVLTGLGVMVWDLFYRVGEVEYDRAEGKKYIIVIQHIESIQKDQEQRLRVLEHKCIPSQRTQ